MKTLMAKILLDHPKSVDETYFQHMRFASTFAAGLLVAAGAALIHAIIPCLCEKTASNKIKELYGRMSNR